ncbi:Ecm21p Ecym_8085 [Eremothecium cymbalariae DBVPG|uniref:Arrestin C-terminal-like domain-containing protein n=1 Tax=Eremothecium cymbalariae (strain CBS 270.75 / DBVPG 7215 / KCTC 17166 / NRRL Y-17582) TaxID=931890 RepID=G8JX06_ERECY|nr:Hypothetical protein Ecym_8085 [Eremothecium cymbalariae DBVPG\
MAGMSRPPLIFNPAMVLNTGYSVLYTPEEQESPVSGGHRQPTDNKASALNADETNEQDEDREGMDFEHMFKVVNNAGNLKSEDFLSSQQFLVEYLTERGFFQPKVLVSKQDVSVFLVNSGDKVFIPTVSTSEDEYLSNVSGLYNEHLSYESRTQSVRRVAEDVNVHETASITNFESGTSNLARTAATPTTDITENGSVAFNIAVVLSVRKPIQMSELNTLLYSRAKVYWNNGVPPNRFHFEESFTIGEVKWELTNENYQLYVPFHISTKDQVLERNDNISAPRVFKNNNKCEHEEVWGNSKKRADYFLEKISNNVYDFKPGNYVYVLRIFFSSHIPETIYVPSGRLNYEFCCAAKFANSGTPPSSSITKAYDTSNECSSKSAKTAASKITGKLLRLMKSHLHPPVFDVSSETLAKYTAISGSMPLKVVRTPPLSSVSTADKPIYINRVWTDAMSYEISLAQKYVPLNSELPFKIKLVPLMKHVSIKRIRVNITEKITFVSKDLKYEFDQVDAVSQDPYNPYFSDLQLHTRPGRSLSLLEIRTKEKGKKALREEIVDNTISENLLSYTSVSNKANGGKSLAIVDALTLETKLKFPRYDMLDRKSSRSIPPYGIDDFVPIQEGSISHRNNPAYNALGIFSGRRSSSSTNTRNSNIEHSVLASTASSVPPSYPVTKFKSNSNVPVAHHTKLNKPKRGLYMDSVNFRNIHVKHKLEIMLRVSKRDLKDFGKLKHYEVLIDTPIILTSEHCSRQNLDLPTYDMVNKDNSYSKPSLPSFEEVISVPNSPTTSPIISPIVSPEIFPSFDTEELSIQQYSLSRATTCTQGGDAMAPPEISAGRRYSNIDEMMRLDDTKVVIGPSNPIFRYVSKDIQSPETHSLDSERRNDLMSERSSDPPDYNQVFLSSDDEL